MPHRPSKNGLQINKAKKGLLRAPLPVGYVYDDEGNTVVDPDKEVAGAIRLLFATFKERGTAFGVVQHFCRNGLKFPKRSYGGAWDGKLVWGSLVHGRVLGVLKNPEYAGAYVYGRYGTQKTVARDGTIKSRTYEKPMDEWTVLIKDHHEAYVSWEDFLQHRQMLAGNQTNTMSRRLPGPAREGLALLQGLLVCGECGRSISVRYTGNGGIYPVYQCTWRKRDGLSHRHCISTACAPMDEAVSRSVLHVLRPSEIDVAIRAFEELERRSTAVDRQWRLKIERSEYEAQLAQRRYEEVDPSNRLVAVTLERRWNDALQSLEDLRNRRNAHERKQALSDIRARRSEVLALGKELPSLWRSRTTKPKDRKRILRLLIKDIAVKKLRGERNVRLQIRWQGGATEEVHVDTPRMISDRWRHSPEVVECVRRLATTMTDGEIAEHFTEEGMTTNKGNRFTASGVSWIRYKHSIPSPQLRKPGELTVKETAAKFDVSPHVVYYWIERGHLTARKANAGSRWCVNLDELTESRLRMWCEASTRIAKSRKSQTSTARGAQ